MQPPFISRVMSISVLPIAGWCPARKLGFVTVSWGFTVESAAWLGPTRGAAITRLPLIEVCLFGMLAVLVRSDLSKDVEVLVLCQENQVPRRHLRGRLRWDHTDRLWLSALSWLVNRRRWAEIFPVTLAAVVARSALALSA